MKYCKKCIMPDTRPGIKFNKEGICSGCISYEHRREINYKARFEELKKLCNQYKGMNGNSYDCAIAVSGGKDSHYQVYVMKELMGMNPILFSVEDNFTMTEAGKHNLKNISEEFGCDIVSMKPNIKLQKKITRKTFEKYGKPTWLIDRLIYTYPLHMAVKFNTPLLVYGENVSYEYGGGDSIETYSAKEILSNGVASDISLSELVDEDITEKDLYMTIAPTIAEINQLDPIYLSYFVEWNSHKNYLFAKSRGFHSLEHEWDRMMSAENYDQVDSFGYLVHAWMKYPKFGHACITDYTSRYIRYGLMSREEAVKMAKEKEHNLDSKCVADFCVFTGYTETEFWKIIDSWYNKELFTKDQYGRWVLKK